MTRIDDIRNGAVQYRSAEVQDISGHEIYVKAVPYADEFTDVGGGISERFLPGTFARAVKAPERVAVFHDHQGPLVGRGTEVEDKTDGVYIRAKIGKTQAALDFLSLIEDKILDQMSVEFRAINDGMKVERRGDRLFVTHTRAHLTGVAGVPEAAYQGQTPILSARDLQRDRAVEAARAWLAEYKARRIG